MGNPKRYSKEFRERAVRRMKLGENVSQMARDLGVHRTCLYSWKRKLGRQPNGRARGLEADWRDRRIEELEAKVTRLEGIVGRQFEDLDFFESPLRRIDADAAMSVTGGSASTPKDGQRVRFLHARRCHHPSARSQNPRAGRKLLGRGRALFGRDGEGEPSRQCECVSRSEPVRHLLQWGHRLWQEL